MIRVQLIVHDFPHLCISMHTQDGKLFSKIVGQYFKRSIVFGELIFLDVIFSTF